MPIRGLIKKKIAFLSKQVNVFASRLKIMPDQDICHAGGTLAVAVSLELKKPLEARSLEIRFYCVETTRTVSSRTMDHYDYTEDKDLGMPRSTHLRTVTSVSERTVHSEKKLLGSRKIYESGTYRAEFSIPPSGPATRHAYNHDNRKAVWRIEAKLDVPLAVDISSSREIIVKGH